MSAKDLVKARHSMAYAVLGEIHYEPEKYIIRLKSNNTLGRGETETAAWEDAAKRLHGVDSGKAP